MFTIRRFAVIFGLSLISILGAAVMASAASVTLSWTANTESDLSGYNIYYGTRSRNYGVPVPVGKVTSRTIDGLTEGTTYYFAISALDSSGNESGYSSEVTKKITASSPQQPLTAALSAAVASPQQVGTSVRLTASASGGSGQYEYRYYISGPATGNSWRMLRDYSSSPDFTWNTSGYTGDNVLNVAVRNAGSTSSYDAYTLLNFTITAASSGSPSGGPVSSVSLSSSVASPQQVGTSVRFTGSASGGSGQYEYRYWISGPATGYAWRMLRDYSSSPDFTWNTSGYTGSNVINVAVRNAGSSSLYDAYTLLNYTITAASSGSPSGGPVSSASLTASVSSPQRAGAAVRFTASASGGSGQYEYRYWISGPATGYAWRMLRDYSSSPDFNWNTSGYTGDNVINVAVRNAGSSSLYDTYKLMNFRVY